MAGTLALIHTSMVFIAVETTIMDLLKEVLPETRLINLVDDSLLPDVVAEGKVTDAVADRMGDLIVAAEKTGANAILSLCSSLGPAVDLARKRVAVPVIKIDDAMAEAAARQSDRLAVVATVPTTLGPTCDLVREKAESLHRTISIERCLVEGAFEQLMRGNREEHDTLVLEAGERLAATVDMVVFAQASMTRLAQLMEQRTGLRVLTSPRMGFEQVRRVLALATGGNRE